MLTPPPPQETTDNRNFDLSLKGMFASEELQNPDIFVPRIPMRSTGLSASLTEMDTVRTPPTGS